MRRIASSGRATVAAAAVVALATASLLAACSEPAPTTSTGTAAQAASAGCKDGAALLACARRSTIADLVPAKATKATGTPITLGMVNQENTAAGSYPELSQAVQAAVAFVNDQLGGVHGHPIKVEVCNTEFSAEGSTTCGQRFAEERVPAVLGGIDVFGNAIETLADNHIPYIGGIPVSTQSVTSPNSFQWSGGTWGATVAFADHAAHQQKAKRVSIVYGEFGSITHSAEVGKKVLEDAGVKVQMVPYPIMATDISSALNAAAATKPDALFLLAADTGCKAGFDGVHALGLHAALYFVGACASPTITDEVGDEAEGAIFNVEGPISTDQPNADADLYFSVVKRYGKGLDPVGAGTVSFRSFMNLWAVMASLDGDVTPAAITSALKAKKDAPSFMGHPYTCDGKQFAGLPALCSPQQILAKMHDGNLAQVGDWIDVGTIYVG